MTRRSRLSIGLLTLALAASGCGDGGPAPRPMLSGSGGEAGGQGFGVATTAETLSDPATKKAILENVLKLIRDGATNVGGDNFTIATESLNDYFLDVRAEDLTPTEATLQFLRAQSMPPGAIEAISGRQFTKEDSRHIEDNLLYHAVAVRVAGEGDELTRVRRVFDWVVRNVVLVPNGTFAQAGIEQAQVRPYDVLVRAMATEAGSGWSERGWLFLVLCRQLGIDGGMLVYTPPGRPVGPIAAGPNLGPMALEQGMAAGLSRRPPRVWACAVLIGGKPYLFEPALGLPIPTADGRGVATLEEAATDPSVLGQLDLPGRNYEPSRADLAAGPVRVLLESSLGSLSPRMKLLQRDLAGKNRMVLYRDPAEQAEAFRAALGGRYAGADLWSLPMAVEYRLFHDGGFVRATQYSLAFFDARWPLLAARLDQLRGELTTAIQSYVAFRYSDSTLEADGRTRVAKPVQDVLDVFATYFLALAQREKGDAKQANFLFGKALEILPEPAPAQPYYTMFRWGAKTNLGLLLPETGELPLAVRYLCEEMPTPQAHGNLVRARALIWQDPFAPPSGTPAVIVPKSAPTH